VKSPMILLVALILSGCSQQTMIRTQPAGANVWVNLVRLEKESPATFETRSGFPDTARIKVDLEGYQTLRDIPVEKSYRADYSLLLLIPGIIPYFFSARFDHEITLTLKENRP
jgi:hypothetical protein